MTSRKSVLDADSEGTGLATVLLYVDVFLIAISRHFQLATFRGEDQGSADQCLTVVVVFVLPESPSVLSSDTTAPKCVCVCVLAAGREPGEHPTAESVMQG